MALMFWQIGAHYCRSHQFSTPTFRNKCDTFPFFFRLYSGRRISIETGINLLRPPSVSKQNLPATCNSVCVLFSNFHLSDCLNVFASVCGRGEVVIVSLSRGRWVAPHPTTSVPIPSSR